MYHIYSRVRRVLVVGCELPCTRTKALTGLAFFKKALAVQGTGVAHAGYEKVFFHHRVIRGWESQMGAMKPEGGIKFP